MSNETHPFNVHDLWAMERNSDPRVSPNGRWVVFEKKVYDIAENKGCSDLWLAPAAASGATPPAPRRLTSHEAGSSHARWSPDGSSIYFLSARSGSSQIWKLPIDGGEAQQVSRLARDVGSFVVSPDGKRIALSMEVIPGGTPEETKDELEAREKKKASGRIYDRLFIRHWDTWRDGTRSHLFVMPAAGGAAVDIMKDEDADVPSKPFGGAEEYTFTPDGRHVLFVARNVGREEAWSTRFDLFLAPADASAAPHICIESNGASMTCPVFSPDGSKLAYLAMRRPGFEADRWRIVIVAWPHRTQLCTTEAWDRSPTTIVWSTDGTCTYTTADHLGQHALFAVDADTGAAREVVREGRNTAPAVAGSSVVFCRCHLNGPAELHAVPGGGGEPKPLTNVNAARLARVRVGEPEQFTFQGWQDETVYAYVVRPADLQESRRYPVAFMVHGGPQGSFGNDFHYRWNPQVYAGAGYAVVMVDFHGSTGYGQAFTDAISGRWGDAPFIDLQRGLEAALKRYPWMDGDRVAALGASYGGYMINWIAGNWPDRFRCLVNHDGNLCERMAYYDTEELWFPEWEFGGPPYEDAAPYERYNPINHVAKWKTPMLVIHSERDFRVVATQGIATFTALQRRGVPSRLVYFPDENHWVLKPANSVLWHETVLAWLDQWTK
ncbi:MAG: S9 family peptidase [Phycisphaerales bacterium]|nr:MAG: S9 family peptidase [Phycisphaerales bacterium]